MTRAVIALGSNLGDRSRTLGSAITALGRLPETVLVATSSLREYAALVQPGSPPGPPFLNAAALVETSLTARGLLERLLEIERGHGRDRGSVASVRKWSARTLDLDLIFHGQAVVDEPGLRVPHPEMHRRLFVLEPLAEIAADWRHPVLGRTVRDLLAEVRGVDAKHGR